MKKAIFFDIDGTLIDCFNGMMEISDEVKESIRELQKQGDYVFIASGRPYLFLDKHILDFGFDGFVLCNGAHVIINDETIYKGFMEKDFINDLTYRMNINEIQHLLISEKEVFVKDNTGSLKGFYDEIGIDSKKFNDKFKTADINVNKVELLCNHKEDMDYCKAIVDRHSDYGYFSSIEGNRHLEIYKKENTKALGIIKVLEHLDIDIENSYAFGDGGNDIEMLSTVGCGIAMGNASDYVKGYANYVTDTVHNHGVAVGIREYIL